MARIDIPEGDQPEEVRVWSLHPKFGAAVAKLSGAIYGDSVLPPRVREAARMRVARINNCQVCLAFRIPGLESAGVDEDLYANVENLDFEGYSEQERLAIEYTERFVYDHQRIDDAFWARMHAAFTDQEILELTICIGGLIALGRTLVVLDVAHAHA